MLGTDFSIAAEDARWVELTHVLWEPFITRGPTEGDVIEVRGRFPAWSIHAEDPELTQHLEKWPCAGDGAWELAITLRYAFIERTRARWERLLDLHAGCVHKEGGAVLLPGTNGVGKTTLVLELVKKGWSYFSDDLSPIDKETALVQAFPKPLGLRDPSAWERYAPRWAPPTWLPRPQGSFLLPAAAVDAPTRGRIRIAAVVFPTYQPNAELKVDPLSRAEAISKTAGLVRNIDPQGFNVLRTILDAVPSYQISHGSSLRAAETIDNLLV